MRMRPLTLRLLQRGGDTGEGDGGVQRRNAHGRQRLGDVAEAEADDRLAGWAAIEAFTWRAVSAKRYEALSLE